MSALLLVAALAACAGDAGSVAGPIDVGPATLPDPASIGNPLAGASFWVDVSSNAQHTADAWRASRPDDAAQMDKIAREAVAHWFGSSSTDVRRDVDVATTTSIAAGTVPLFVAYNIPQRDCGGSSGGNSTTAAAYRSWIAAFAAGIGTRRASVILEPDALAGMDCLPASDQQSRLELMKFAVQILSARPGITLYLDGGNPGWRSAATMASRLTSAGVALTQGFALNVSNFRATDESLRYGTAISALVGGKHFIVDTGRNGRGPAADGAWCNPAGRALGSRPTTSTGHSLADAFLWVKAPGESDGACNGGVSTGTWMPEYALGLAMRAGY